MPDILHALSQLICTITIQDSKYYYSNFTNEKNECFEKSVTCPVSYKLYVEEWAVNPRTHFLTGVLAMWTDTHNQGR